MNARTLEAPRVSSDPRRDIVRSLQFSLSLLLVLPVQRPLCTLAIMPHSMMHSVRLNKSVFTTRRGCVSKSFLHFDFPAFPALLLRQRRCLQCK